MLTESEKRKGKYNKGYVGRTFSEGDSRTFSEGDKVLCRIPGMISSGRTPGMAHYKEA